MRKMMDDYLDGVLGAAERAELEKRIASERAVAGLVARMKGERALRVAAMGTFAATQQEAETAAARVMAEIEGKATIGYVGVWVKRVAAVAAVLVVVAGSFVVGRMTASIGGIATEPQVIYRVLYFADSGEAQAREFSSLEDANAFMNRQDVKRGLPQVTVADAILTRPGEL